VVRDGLVVRGLGLIAVTSILDLPGATRAAAAGRARQTAGWADVADELTRSCAARAAAGTLLIGSGVVGVLAGAAPIVWVHGAINAASLVHTLASSEVVEVNVRADDLATTRALEAAGWRTESVTAQLVHPGRDAEPQAVPDGYTIAELAVADLPEFRTVLAASGGASAALVAACYGDDFFVRAAPAWLFGARDAAGRLVAIVGVRRQERSAMVFGLAVDPEHRSAGLGRALVDTAVGAGRRAGAAFAHASAESDALPLALSCGFHRVGAWRRLGR
jgi:GNAT superfamily N-acetyltransferase